MRTLIWILAGIITPLTLVGIATTYWLCDQEWFAALFG